LWFIPRYHVSYVGPGYLTGCWLQGLTVEKTILEETFASGYRDTRSMSSDHLTSRDFTLEHIYYNWLGLSLFAPTMHK
jgi:hypothetical protein